MRYTFHTADVFTDRPFGGNPLAVIPDARGLNTAQMQAITREFNLSETTFVLPPEDESHTVRVRIFTPGAELPFAGHPTVGTALVLAWTGAIDLEKTGPNIVLGEGVGPIPVQLTVEAGKAVSAQFSVAQLPTFGPDMPADEAAGLINLNPGEVLSEGHNTPTVASCGLPFLVIPVSGPEALARATINIPKRTELLSGFPTQDVYIVSNTAQGIRARMFGHDIPEDPATGSAASALAGYLARLSGQSDGTLNWSIEQGVEMGRPSTIHLEADKVAGEITAIRVAGSAVPISSGEIEAPPL